MTKQRFDDFIRENRDQFDSEQAPAGLWAKIQEQRNPKQATRVIQLMPMLRRVAAVLIFGLAVVGVYSLFQDQAAIVDNSAYIPPEIAEMDRYYEQQVNDALVELNSMVDDESISMEISSELEYLEQEKIRLLKELRNNVDNEKIIEELIKTYRLRLEVLEDVLDILKSLNKEDHKDDFFNRNKNEFNI